MLLEKIFTSLWHVPVAMIEDVLLLVSPHDYIRVLYVWDVLLKVREEVREYRGDEEEKEKKAEEETNKILAQLRAELVVSNELQQKLERKVNFIESENALLENRQKELKETINNLLQSRESFVKAYELTSQIITFEHDGNWSKALEFYDLQVRSEPMLHTSGSTNFSIENSQGAAHASLSRIEDEMMHKKPYKGLIRSLQQIGSSHVLDVYCQGLTSQKGQFQRDLEFTELQTLAELREEENLLLKERRELKMEVAALRVNLEKQRATSESLKRMKFHYGVFFAYMRLREQEIRNLMWISECVAQNQKSRVHDSVVFIF
ncbi:Non-specific serine/threonine protein kinase [Abeliophyllum distichum]|uniref:Non-specific serine/threonine protein kinase n=1 Tax=Abeliophyllum distichum TaxID=126358 RepID=A0ABD1UK99_9LAMI